MNNTGVAAHICAASKGGARYKLEMTDKQRKSIDNAIWLCANCSIKIDRDEETYPVQLLLEWKSHAEENAKLEQGKKLPRKEDAIDTTAMALTGFPKRFITDAISNIHQASAKSLEAIDPRFEVKTAHTENGTHFMFFAKQNVPFNLNVEKTYADDFFGKFNNLLEHGEELEVNSRAIQFEKLPFFDDFSAQFEDGSLIIAPSKTIQSVQKLWITEQLTGNVETFDDVVGEIRLGNKSFTFKGSACNGLFNVSLSRMPLNSNLNGSIEFSLLTEGWEGIDICSLPYFNKISSFFSKLIVGWKLNTTLEINGERLLVAKEKKFDDSSMEVFYGFLKYIERVQVVSRFTGVKLQYSSKVSFTAEEHEYLADVVEVFQGNQFDTKLSKNATCELIADSEAKNVEFLMDMKQPVLIEFIESTREQIELFGTKITLPNKKISMESVLPKIDQDISDIKDGDIVTIEWIPCENFSAKISYENAI
ncbi:hypothetical protein [Methylovulum miyakonense]|uniref:hypothetical protein n=1 Tax=Methylovulum miyakonense TaxID=645578 RepID=UPI0012EB6881|nr:hypothetical protein [Methylovulum miyakonense]